jgi:fructose-bisphosphate aldolase class II
MPLVTLNDVLPAARKGGYGVVALNVANLETLYSVVRAAEEVKSPLIVQVYQRLFEDKRAELIAVMTRRLAEESDLPIVLHLDHGSTLEQIRQAIDIGYTSVMIDGSPLPFEENVELTSKAAQIAHQAGVTIEGEIGHVPFGDGEIQLSEPGEAKDFVEQTGVDALAISVGTAHGFYKSEPKLNIQRIQEIAHTVSIPLVLHGGTGVPDEQLQQAIQSGVAKINIATELQSLFVKSIAAEIEANGDKFLPVDLYFKPAEEKLVEYAKLKMLSFQTTEKSGLI